MSWLLVFGVVIGFVVLVSLVALVGTLLAVFDGLSKMDDLHDE
jgi:hypothetical protein